MHLPIRRTALPAGALGVVASLTLASCGSGGSAEPEAQDESSKQPSTALVTTFDGGLHILDDKSLKVTKTIKLDGFNRVNAAGDDQHVIVSTDDGFRVLDAAAGKFTDVEFPGAEPGHVVRHAGKTVLFTDGTGETRVFDPKELAGGEPEVRSFKAEKPHHGVSIELANKELVTTIGDEETRSGAQVLDANDKQIAESDECPGAHGEAAAKDEAVAIGCEDGVLLYQDGEFSKIKAPDDYGRTGTQAGSDSSPVLLGDYKVDEEAELERPKRVALIDTRTKKLKLVKLGVSYSFRSLGRGPHGEGLVLGTDGKIHVIDPEKGKVTKKIAVTGKWREPVEWQDPRPTLFVRDHTAYVTEPKTKQLHAVDLDAGKKVKSAKLPDEPNELNGVVDAGDH